jgi:hypothetical protein
VLVVWGYYWREVYDAAPLIAAQLLFAYGFDSLLSWTHRRTFVLGFGAFPIIFSLTLFFWFKDPWFYWQFVMVAIGLAAKEFLRWKRDGVNTHIFNPSSFPLAVVGLALLLADASETTWGSLVAQTQFYPPHMYLLIFLVSLPGQYLFGVTTMTMTAVVTTFAFSALYHAATGSFYFVDSHVPIAVFLGMHLLFTDPSTSPRSELGRIFYGVLYGLTTVLLYDLLLRANMPGFYDKLLQVPLLNLSVILLDRLARSPRLRGIDPSAWGRAWAPRRRHLAYIGVWTVRLRRHECVRVPGRQAPGPVDAVLGAGLRGRWPRCLSEPVLPPGGLLCGRVRVGVQRGRHPAGQPLRQSHPRRRGVRPGVRTAVRRRLRECRGRRDGRRVPRRRPDRRRLPVHPAGEQGTDPGVGARAALRARLRVGVAGHLRTSIAVGQVSCTPCAQRRTWAREFRRQRLQIWRPAGNTRVLPHGRIAR